MLNDMAFGVSEAELDRDDTVWWHTLRRHISYFAGEEVFGGLIENVGEENEFYDRLIALVGDFDAHRPRRPFAKWRLWTRG